MPQVTVVHTKGQRDIGGGKSVACKWMGKEEERAKRQRWVLYILYTQLYVN